MLHGESAELLIGAILLGFVHGIEPGHGWPVAATYALDQTNKWLYGLAASSLLGIGHLISSIAMVGAFFYAKSYFSLTQVNEPIELLEGITIGGPVSIVAGVLLIGLGIREYQHGHDHGHGHDHNHNHEESSSHAHDHADSEDSNSILGSIKSTLVGEHGHSHSADDAADRGLWGIAWFAFVLGFAHEEEFEIIALCAGSTHCLELMTVYALTVIVGIVGLTLLLIGGYERYEDRVEGLTPYLPVFSAVVLIGMGIGFISGLF